MYIYIRTTSDWGRGEVSPALSCKKKKNALIKQKNALILEESVLFKCIFGLTYYWKYSFKSILEEKHPNFSLRGSTFVCHTRNIY